MMAINPEESLAPMQMPVSHVGSTLQDLLAETCQYLAPEDMERIERAYELAKQAHMGVHRRSGEAYIQHPLEVALLLRLTAPLIAGPSAWRKPRLAQS